MTTKTPVDITQRIDKMRRLANALMVSINALEAEMMESYAAPRTDADIAAQQARSVVYQQGPSEVKVMHS